MHRLSRSHCGGLHERSIVNTWHWQRVENPWQEPENTTAVFALNAWRGHLYLGTRNLHNGGEVLRSADGIHWHSIAAQGFGDAANRDIYGFVGFKDMLYAGTYNAVRGDHHTESDRGAEIWRSASGSEHSMSSASLTATLPADAASAMSL